MNKPIVSQNQEQESLLSEWAAQPEVDPKEFNPESVVGVNNVIPDLPRIPGYTLGWVPISTAVQNNDSRTHTARLQGWRPVSCRELAVYDASMVSTFRRKIGELDVIQIMDVIACKIPTPVYRKILAAEAQQIINSNVDRQTHGDARGGSFRREVFEEQHGYTKDGVRKATGSKKSRSTGEDFSDL